MSDIIPRIRLFPMAKQYLTSRNPWVPVWWSVILPGFGHLYMGQNLKGFILMSWEILVNDKANLNLAIYHTLTGNYHQAQAVLDIQWLIIYPLFYIFAMFDSYRTCVEINQLSKLERLQTRRRFQRVSLSWPGITTLSRQSPLLAGIWSAALPGAGQLYAARGPKALTMMGWYLAVILKSGLGISTYYALLGDFQQAQQHLNFQWLLFWPSIYIFGIVDAYADTAEQNNIVDEAFRWRMRKYLLNGRK